MRYSPSDMLAWPEPFIDTFQDTFSRLLDAKPIAAPTATLHTQI
jgi:hypothetical protein